MYTHQWNDRSDIGSFMASFDEKCRYLMRVAGGAISREVIRTTPAVYITPEQKARAIELATTTNLTVTEIARAVGGKQTAICRLLVRAGCKPPVVRKGAVK